MRVNFTAALNLLILPAHEYSELKAMQVQSAVG